jgi:NAD(P)H-nitrite reductase large subunit
MVTVLEGKAMDKADDPEVCLCFHVPLGKLAKFHRLHRPRVASQLSQCQSAGTGCGWCVPFLEQLFEQMERGEAPRLDLSPEEYARRRKAYHRRQGKSEPPKDPGR